MGMRITNMTEVVYALQLTDRLVNDQAREVMKQGAEKIKNDARHFAPVEFHGIEKALKLLPSQGNRYSLRMTVAVTGVVNGRNIDEYAAIVHEYAWHKRGPLTRLKGPQAGPRYLVRAVNKNKKTILDGLEKAMSSGISTAIARSGVNKPRKRRKR